MNEYIVNPWIFYWISTLDTLKFILAVLATFTPGIFLISCLHYTNTKDDFYNYDKSDYGYARMENKYQNSKLYLKISVITLVISSLMLIFIPNEKTMYKMFIDSTLTKQNIEITRDFIIESIDKAADKIVEKGEKKNR